MFFLGCLCHPLGVSQTILKNETFAKENNEKKGTIRISGIKYILRFFGIKILQYYIIKSISKHLSCNCVFFWITFAMIYKGLEWFLPWWWKFKKRRKDYIPSLVKGIEYLPREWPLEMGKLILFSCFFDILTIFNERSATWDLIFL